MGGMCERALTREEQAEFKACAGRGMKLIGGKDGLSTPQSVVEAVEAYVGNWHKPTPGFWASIFNRKPDQIQAALALGAVWGDQLARRFKWQWTCVQQDGNDLYAVVSPDRSLAIFPTYFVKACLDDPHADCTMVLAFNMLAASSIPALPPNSYQDVMEGVARIVPGDDAAARDWFPDEYKVFRFQEGDLLSYQSDGKWGVTKVLKVDKVTVEAGASINIQGQNFTAPVRDYLLVVGTAIADAEYPTLDALKEAVKSNSWKVKIGHVPRRTSGIGDDAIVLANQPVTETELSGYRLWKEAFDKDEAGIF